MHFPSRFAWTATARSRLMRAFCSVVIGRAGSCIVRSLYDWLTHLARRPRCGTGPPIIGSVFRPLKLGQRVLGMRRVQGRLRKPQSVFRFFCGSRLVDQRVDFLLEVIGHRVLSPNRSVLRFWNLGGAPTFNRRSSPLKCAAAGGNLVHQLVVLLVTIVTDQSHVHVAVPNRVTMSGDHLAIGVVFDRARTTTKRPPVKRHPRFDLAQSGHVGLSFYNCDTIRKPCGLIRLPSPVTFVKIVVSHPSISDGFTSIDHPRCSAMRWMTSRFAVAVSKVSSADVLRFISAQIWPA